MVSNVAKLSSFRSALVSHVHSSINLYCFILRMSVLHWVYHSYYCSLLLGSLQNTILLLCMQCSEPRAKHTFIAMALWLTRPYAINATIVQHLCFWRRLVNRGVQTLRYFFDLYTWPWLCKSVTTKVANTAIFSCPQYWALDTPDLTAMLLLS